MFKQNTVISIKVGKNFLPDQDSIVKLPFGSEYSILIKNLNNSPIKVRMFIDGNINGPEKGFLIKEKDSFEINSFFNTNNALKFVNKSKELNKHREENIEDSLIRFEVDILNEKESKNNFSDLAELLKKSQIKKRPFESNKPWDNYPKVDLHEHPFLPEKNNTFGGNYNPYEQVFCSSIESIYSNESSLIAYSNESGITVPGKKIEKQIVTELNEIKYIKKESLCFIFKLESTNENISFDKEKKVCLVCNKKYKSKYNYCPIDGSYLN